MNSRQKVTPISSDELRLEAACRWVLTVDEGLSEDDAATLEAWLAEDSRNSAALLEVAQVWDKLDSLSRLAELFPVLAERPRKVEHAQWFRPVALGAASLVLAAAVGWLLLFELGPSGFGNDRPHTAVAANYSTAVGEQKTVLLPDGSEVVLNTDTVLRVGYSEYARVLHLLRGELHVDVAVDTTRPLSVIAGDRIVQAVGTSFRVEINERNHIEVLVTEGIVRVGVQPDDRIPPPTEDSDEVIAPPVLEQTVSSTVEAGESLVLGAADQTVSTVSPEEIEVQLSWKEGSLIFRSEPLERALAEVERYTTVQFVIVDEQLKSKALSGRFRAGDIDVLLASLEVNLKIAHRYDEEGRLLLTSM